MKIAVIGLRGFPNIQGGVEKHCENIIPRLHHDWEFFVYRRRPYIQTTSGIHESTSGNIKYIDLPSTRIKGFETLFHTFLAVIHIILNHKADIVNIHNIGPGLFTPILRIFGYKVVLTYHSPNYEHSKWNSFSRAIFKLGERLSLRYANSIIFVNKFQQEKLRTKIKTNSVYIPNGIDNVTKSNNTDFLLKHGIEPNKYILAVGRLTPEKGFDTLIKAINSMEGNYKLVIAGDSDNDPQYTRFLKNLDTNHKVTFTGFTCGENLRQLYSHARLFVLSSINEGFPIVLLEAMSYRLPVIVTDIPATHLLDLPENICTPPGNADLMAHRIKKLYDSTSSNNIYNSELSNYSWDNIARQTSQLYESIK